MNTVLNVNKTGNFLDHPTQFVADVTYGWFLRNLAYWCPIDVSFAKIVLGLFWTGQIDLVVIWMSKMFLPCPKFWTNRRIEHFQVFLISLFSDFFLKARMYYPFLCPIYFYLAQSCFGPNFGELNVQKVFTIPKILDQ